MRKRNRAEHFQFSKQSMIETYTSFVDNFPYAKSAITQARTKPSFDKYYNVSFLKYYPAVQTEYFWHKSHWLEQLHSGVPHVQF